MKPASFTIRPLDSQDQHWVLEMVRHWGETDYVLSRGRVLHPAELPGYCAVGARGRRLGLATYELAGPECQLVTLHALRPYRGIGTALLATVRQTAVAHGCHRLWLITTNDNLDALRFYQRRGLQLVAVHRDLREVAQRLKPSLPLLGEHGIPIRDELELEMRLD